MTHPLFSWMRWLSIMSFTELSLILLGLFISLSLSLEWLLATLAPFFSLLALWVLAPSWFELGLRDLGLGDATLFNVADTACWYSMICWCWTFVSRILVRTEIWFCIASMNGLYPRLSKIDRKRKGKWINHQNLLLYYTFQFFATLNNKEKADLL